MNLDAPNYAALSAMITPAILMTSNGSLIISTSNRMARVVDRIRVLNDLGDNLCRGATELDYVPDRLAHIRDQQDRLVWRSDRIQYALTALYMSFGVFVGASLALALNVWTGHRLAVLPEIMAVVGVILMLGACIQLVLEAAGGAAEQPAGDPVLSRSVRATATRERRTTARRHVRVVGRAPFNSGAASLNDLVEVRQAAKCVEVWVFGDLGAVEA